MDTVEEIIESVKRLDERAKGEFLARLSDVDFDDVWDRQIEADAANGKLDELWRNSLADIAAGRARPLEQDFGADE